MEATEMTLQERLRSFFAHAGATAGHLPLEAAAELDRLQARVAELEVDAERYRWLRENCRGGQEDTKEPQLIHASDPMDGSSWREWLDAAIDTARKAKP